MTMPENIRGAVVALQIAGWMNIIGIPASTRLFTDDVYFKMAPITYSRPALLLAWLAGYMLVSTATSAPSSPKLLALYTLEKGYFAAAGFHWLATRSHTHRQELKALSPATYRMFHLNGPVDGFWAIVFAFLLSRALKRSDPSA